MNEVFTFATVVVAVIPLLLRGSFGCVCVCVCVCAHALTACALLHDPLHALAKIKLRVHVRLWVETSPAPYRISDLTLCSRGIVRAHKATHHNRPC